MCHARTKCYDLKRCANYTISKDYWEVAGSPTIIELSGYEDCIADDNCIKKTITNYVNNIGIKV